MPQLMQHLVNFKACFEDLFIALSLVEAIILNPIFTGLFLVFDNRGRGAQIPLPPPPLRNSENIKAMTTRLGG